MNAMREGLQNAYQYSKTVNGPLAQAMDSFASSAQVVRNQLGAALGGAIVAILPLIQTLANALARAAEYVTMFFAALNGQSTYKKAINNTVEWGKAATGAGKAAKEWKNQLMGFDEINRPEAPEDPGGGGGGGTGANFGDMFEQADIPDWMERLGERIKDLLPTIKAIGIALAGLSVLKLLGQVLGLGDAFSGVMSKIIGLGVAILGAVLLWDGFADAINNGVDWGNLAEMIGGATLLVIGLGVAFGSTGAAIGLLIGGLALCIVGLREWIQTGQASTPVLTAITAGLLAVGGAFALLTGNWIPLVIAAIGAAVVWIVGKWDTIQTKWDLLWNGILNSLIDYVNAILDWIRPVLQAIDAIVGFFGWQSNLGGAHINNIPAPAAFATGGMPEDGLFMANHGELVGQFSNGNTAVANNEQIIQGIERGVYNAVTSAMANNNGNGSRDIRVFLDGKEIGAATRRYERNMNRATGVALG